MQIVHEPGPPESTRGPRHGRPEAGAVRAPLARPVPNGPHGASAGGMHPAGPLDLALFGPLDSSRIGPVDSKLAGRCGRANPATVTDRGRSPPGFRASTLLGVEARRSPFLRDLDHLGTRHPGAVVTRWKMVG